MTWIAAPRSLVVGMFAVAGLVVACGGDGDGGIEPSAFAGDWDISLVVGGVDADPGADPAGFPGDTTYREHWVIDGCDATSCILHRPDGGLLLGDLDGADLEIRTGGVEGDEERFVAEATAAAVPRGGEHSEPEPEPAGQGPPAPEEDEHGDHPEGGEDPCIDSPAQRWRVRIEVGELDGVLSGTVIRTPESLRVEVGGITCYGLDLTMGFSGTPRATGDSPDQG